MSTVAMIILKPFQFCCRSVASLGKMRGSSAPVSLNFCHRDATAGFLIPVVLSFDFAVTKIHIFSCISESVLMKYPSVLFWMWSQIGREL